MKPIIYKTFKSVPPFGVILLFILLYFPSLLLISEEFNIVQATALFSYSGLLSLAFLSEKSYWDNYNTVLPVPRSSFVSVPFILVLCFNLIQLILSVTFYVIGSVTLGDGFSFICIAKLFACYIIGSAFAGLPLILVFKLSYKVIHLFLGFSYGSLGFFIGFTDGFTETNPPAIAFINDGRVYAVAALVSAILFVLEWFVTCRIYSNKDL